MACVSDQFNWRDVNARRLNSRKEKKHTLLSRQRFETQINLHHYSKSGIHKGTRSEIQQSIVYSHIKTNMSCISDFRVFTFNDTIRIIGICIKSSSNRGSEIRRMDGQTGNGRLYLWNRCFFSGRLKLCFLKRQLCCLYTMNQICYIKYSSPHQSTKHLSTLVHWNTSLRSWINLISNASILIHYTCTTYFWSHP